MDPDINDQMARLPLDHDTCERLLSGRMSPLDAPPSLRGVAALFEAAAAPAYPPERAAREQVAAAAAELVHAARPYPLTTPARRRPVLSKVLTAKFAAAATIAAFGLGTAAAAATGSLPGQASNASSHATTGLATASSHIGSQAASGSGHTPTSANSTPSGSLPKSGPANSHAQFGLCTAFLAAGKSQTSSPTSAAGTTPPQYNSTAFKALIAQNGSVAKTTTYCTGVVAKHPTGDDQGDTDQPSAPGKPADTGKPAGTGKPSAPGSSNGHAPVSTPNSGGTGTADGASGGASSSGTSTANTASGGASSAGSANAGSHH